MLTEAVFYIKNCMEMKPFEAFSVPIVAEDSAGHRFGEMHELG
jgi:DNA polymerase-1